MRFLHARAIFMAFTGILCLCGIPRAGTIIQRDDDHWDDPVKRNLADILGELKKRYNVHILFNDQQVQDIFINYELVDYSRNFEQNLESVLRGTGLKYRKTKKDSYLVTGQRMQDAGNAESSVPQLLSLVDATSISVELPDQRVEGRIVDDKGDPLPGVSVLLKGTQTGTISDGDGRFTLTVPNEHAVLVFSFVGYVSEEVVVGARTRLEITLAVDEKSLEEVVVVGYGTQKKVNLTGAIEVVDAERLQNRPVMNVSQALQATVSGVNFSYGNFGAEPGAQLKLQIRGQGEPYVLIDGTVGDINSLNPSDIASISILKDAAASAIYGARAPYGVVLITTKSGKNNEKIRVDFSSNVSKTDPIRKPHWVDSYTFTRAMNEFHDNQGEARLFAESTIDRIIAYINDPSLPETVPDPTNPRGWATYLVSNANNDWYDIHFGTGLRHQENISVSGGAKDVAFYLSAGHNYEKGILNYGTDNFRRINLSTKLDINLTSWWKLSLISRYAQSTRIKPNYDSEGDYGMMIHQVFRTQPQQYLKSPNGYYSQLSRIPMIESGTDLTVNRDFMQRFAAEFSPMKNWTINADYSFNLPVENFVSENFTAYQDYVDGSMFAISTTVPSYIRKYKSQVFYDALNLYTTYKFDLANRHHFALMAGYQQEFNKLDLLLGQKRELITAQVPSLTTATGEMQTSDQLTHWATQGYFARFNYDYQGKYLLEFNTRYDGTSRFAKGKRWGFFPSLSLGWNIAEENFWKPLLQHVNAFKLRASWGSLGNQNVAAYQDIPLLSVNTNLGWILQGARPAYTGAPNLINPNLTWESSETTDIGIDMGFLNNRLQLSADYYQRLTFDRLGPAMALPALLGASVPNENNSELRTRGWDISLTWRDKRTSDFSYSITAMMFDNTSVVTKYNNPTGILTTDYSGKKVGEIWGYETVGLIQTQEEADLINQNRVQAFINAQTWRTGDVRYRDLNGDGVINNGRNTVTEHGDLRIIGNTTPRYQFGLNLSANYRNFDFSAFFNGTGKRDLWLNSNIFWGFQNWNFTVLYPHHLDYYRDAEATKYSGLGVNTDAYYPRPYSQSAQYSKNQQVQTRYLQNAAYFRLKNIQLGYTLPKGLQDRLKLNRTRFYFSGENVFTVTKLPIGFDPETANLGEQGHGKSMFMLAVYSLGLTTSF